MMAIVTLIVSVWLFIVVIDVIMVVCVFFGAIVGGIAEKMGLIVGKTKIISRIRRRFRQ
jgi:hypothetical protein